MNFVWKTNEEGKGAETIILLIFALWGCFSCWWVRGDGVGQKVIFSGSWNLIFCLSPRLKSWSVKGASRHPVFMILVLIKEMRRGRWVQDFIFFPPDVWELPLRPTAKEVAQVSACGVFVDDWVNGGLFLFCWGMMLLWVMGMGFEKTCTVLEKWIVSKVISKLYGCIKYQDSFKGNSNLM